ncbi:MAG: UDP-N-acetylmuramoyl-L-alanine--D-glutamate ligase [Bdellovibrionales bacterium]
MSLSLEDLGAHSVAIWGAGREGLAATALIRRRWPALPLIIADDDMSAERPQDYLREGDLWVTGEKLRKQALKSASVVVKSPGISLYHSDTQELINSNIVVTSLLNLWSSQARGAKTIAVTGTKGKSTTASLISHILRQSGRSVALLGNIGVPPGSDYEGEASADFCVIEVSSYQAALFDGCFDLAVLTNLEPEHLDWHGSVECYYRDKLNLLARARHVVAPANCKGLLESHLPEIVDRYSCSGVDARSIQWSNCESSFHAELSGEIFNGPQRFGFVNNSFLSRNHNLDNFSAALCALQHFSLDLNQALVAAESYRGLPHRQQIIGERDGIAFVDDSISTTPLTALAALSVWRDKPISLIVGGFDRGLDYSPLIDFLVSNPVCCVSAMGPSGARILQLLTNKHYASPLCCAATMQEAVNFCLQHTLRGGVLLLSPAAPSYGLFKDFCKRGEAFAKCCGL